MTFERSKGKARPTLPRSSGLSGVATVREPRGSRDAHGRFGAGNDHAKGRSWKRAIAKLLGRDLNDLGDVSTSVAEDAWRLFCSSLKEMPHDGANVRALVARKARHEALEGYWTAKALEKLGTPEGDAAEKKASDHGQRAERLTVTALDVAIALAKARPQPSYAWALAPTQPEENEAQEGAAEEQESAKESTIVEEPVTSHGEKAVHQTPGFGPTPSKVAAMVETKSPDGDGPPRPVPPSWMQSDPQLRDWYAAIKK